MKIDGEELHAISEMYHLLGKRWYSSLNAWQVTACREARISGLKPRCVIGTTRFYRLEEMTKVIEEYQNGIHGRKCAAMEVARNARKQRAVLVLKPVKVQDDVLLQEVKCLRQDLHRLISAMQDAGFIVPPAQQDSLQS